MTEQEKREKVIKALEWCTQEATCGGCPYWQDEDNCDGAEQMMRDALALLKAQEPADYIPIDWLMNYAQLPTEFAISAWRKPKKEAEIKQAKSLDKPMSLDDALELLKAQEPRVMTWVEAQANVQDGPFIIFEVRDSTGSEVDFGVLAGDYYEMSEGSVLTVADFWMLKDDYGKRFRLWTSRPDEKRRAETPWE